FPERLTGIFFTKCLYPVCKHFFKPRRLRSMKTLIKKFFNVSDSDVLPVLILIGLGFFMGIFSATYSVASTTLFLNNFDEQSDLPKAFILSGLVGLSSAYLYSYLQRKIRFEKLILIFTATMVAMVAVVIAGF